MMETMIRARGLRKTYGALVALDNFSLEVSKGSIVGILGPNGAGKTTALECMLGTKKPDRGEVAIFGKDPVKDRKSVFEKVGVQFQATGYPEKITVGELVEGTRVLYRKPADSAELLRTFGLEDKRKAFVAALSGGERQRLFVVLALLPDPEVVFLDELTTGLDPRTRKEVWSCLLKQKERGRTIILTSHFMDEVEALCDEIRILMHGREVFAGTVSEAVAATGCERFEDAYLQLTQEDEV